MRTPLAQPQAAPDSAPRRGAEPGSRQGSLVLPTAILIVALSVALAWPWISGTWTVPWDAKAHFQPQFAFLAQSLARGESPFWNPYDFAGWPQIADPQSLIFVPGFLLVALFDPAPSFVVMDATVYGMLLVGALALATYGRDRGWHPVGLVVAALCFAFGGAAAWRIQHTGQVVSLAMLPVAMLFLARAVERRSIAYGIAAGLASGFLAVGRDQVALLAIYLLAAQAATLVLAPDRERSLGARIRGAALPLTAGAVAGLAVIVVPLVLTLALAADSNRPTIDYISAGRGSLHPASLITGAIADLFGQADPKVDYWGPPSVPFGVVDIYLAQNMAAIYAGAIPAATILFVGLARGVLWERPIRFFTIAMLVTLAYVLGWYTPLFKPMFDWLPGVSLYRRPADATFLVGFLLAVLGGYLASRWVEGLGPARVWQRGLQWAFAGLVLAVLPVAFALHSDRLQEAVRPTLTAILCFAGAVLALEGARRIDARSRILGVALVALFTAADLGWNNAPNESTAYPPSEYEALRPDTKDPVVNELKRLTAESRQGARRDRVELAGLGFHWPNVGMVHDLETTLGYNPLRLAWYQAATGAQDTIGLPDQRAFTPLFPSYSSMLANVLGLRWIAANVPLKQIDPKYDTTRIVERARLGKVTIYENLDALPRVRFVTGVRRMTATELLRFGTWPAGYDPMREVVLDRTPAPSTPSEPEGDNAKVEITAYHNTEVVVAVDTAVAGRVVLADVWHRWWRATVDGEPVPIERADGIFRAVAVPAGKHEVRFTFHPVAGAFQDLRNRLKL